MSAGKLYIVATPIGNLKDITLRALDVLREVDFIAAEDTRHTSVLLKQYDIRRPLLSYHEFSGENKEDEILSLLQDGKTIAIVSDAGTPLISDPGYPIVKKARESGLEIVPVPGACAAITAMSVAAMSEGRFLFWGFLDAKASARRKELEKLKESSVPIVFYESPHRLIRSLEDIVAVCGEKTQVSVARELTKMYEEFLSGTAAEMLAEFSTREVRGEFVLIMQCMQEKEEASDEAILAMLQECMKEKMTKKDAVSIVAKRLNLPKNKVYKISLG